MARLCRLHKKTKYLETILLKNLCTSTAPEVCEKPESYSTRKSVLKGGIINFGAVAGP